MPLRLFVVLPLIGLTTMTISADAAEKPIDYSREVRPILADHCLRCHGPDEASRKGGLRLDTRVGALAAGKSGETAIVPGKPAASELLKRITSHEPGEVMPPPRQKNPLTPAQIAILEKWIQQGAEFDQHWAFVPPRRPTIPQNGEPHPIDAIVKQRLITAGLDFSPAAPVEVLARRIYLDLIGLPPSPAQLDAFSKAVSQDRQRAIHQLVDELLASPQFGVKWGRHWLDIARYADSDGYEKDLPRQQWSYRDWVVRSLNQDMPFDQFLREQLAGDLLPNPTQDQIIATGFLRNSMINEEGAIIAEQFRKEAMFDRMDALGKVLGLSLQCAQCHTHKYDPITHTEYFSLFAFLNNTYEAQSWVYTPEQLRQIESIRGGIAQAEADLKAKHPQWAKQLASWEQDRLKLQTAWKVLRPSEVIWVGGLCHPDIQADGSVLNLGHKGVRGELIVTATLQQPTLTGLRLDALTHGDLPFGGPGRSPTGTFAIAEVEVEAATVAKDSKPNWQRVELAPATADIEFPARKLDERYRNDQPNKPDPRTVGPAAFLTDKNENTGWMPDRGPGRRNSSSHAVIPFAKPLQNAQGMQLRIILKFRHAGPSAFGTDNLFLGRFRLSTTADDKPLADPYGDEVRQALNRKDSERSVSQRTAIFTAWREATATFQSTTAAIDKLWSGYPEAATSVLRLQERFPEQTRITYRLDRGAWDKPEEAIAPGILSVLQPLPKTEQLNRITLSKWLTSPDNPLTARVQVNRVWQSLWGLGLVETAEDFGTRGSPPSHPELLDYLALEFQQQGGRLKPLLRHILTSRTYQQSSTLTPQLLEKDPKNRLLARGARFRPDAEVLRDMVLSSSGLLNLKLDGPYIFPPVPEGLLKLSYAKVDFWKTAEGPDRYRRSLYLFRRRSLPDPLLSCFDAPNGDSSIARRQRSNTPLAALAALNEPVLVESARALALRILRKAGPTEAERINYAFRLCTARLPGDTERDALREVLAQTRQRIADGWINVRELTTGQADRLPELPKDCTPADVAAWTVTARVFLNLDETLTKN